MPSTPELLTDYLESVSGEIRWPRARRLLLGELRSHIEDQRQEFLSSGLDDEEALSRAVAEMGDPVEVGRDLDRLHRPRNTWSVVVLVLLIAGFSLFIFGALPTGEHITFRALHQLIGVVVGALMMFALWFSDYTLLLRRPLLCTIGFIFLIILCGPILTNETINGRSMRGLIYLFLSIPILFAAVLCKLKGGKHLTVLICALLAGLLSLPPLYLPSGVTSIYIALSMVFLLLYAVWSGWFPVSKLFGSLCACLPVIFPASLLFQSEYVIRRLQIAFHPELDPLGVGWLSITTRNMLNTLPFINLSGTATQDFHSVLSQDYDFFLLRLANGFGRIVLLAALLLTIILFLLALWRFSKLHSRQGRFLALAALFVLMAEALGYIIYNCGLILLSPIAFPFLSYGIGALMLNFCLVGLILSVMRMDSLVRDVQQPRPVVSRIMRKLVCSL